MLLSVVGTVSEVTLGRLVRDSIGCLWAFLNAWILSLLDVN